MARDPIAELVHRYADAVVHHDEQRWGDTWATDAHWRLGPDRRIDGRPAIVDVWRQAMGAFEAVVQVVFNGTYELDESERTGTGRWYVQEAYRRRGGDPGLLLAHYDDTYRIDDGGWRFTSRALTVHYAGPPDLSAPFLNAWGADG